MAPENDEDEFSMKKSRLDHPTGWMHITRYETVRFIIDALIESPPGHKFNKSELSRRTGMSREAIRTHISLLVELGVVSELSENGWPEYKINDTSRVSKELFQLNSAVNAVLSGQDKDTDGTKFEVDDSSVRLVKAPNISGAAVQPYSVKDHSGKSKVVASREIGLGHDPEDHVRPSEA